MADQQAKGNFFKPFLYLLIPLNFLVLGAFAYWFYQTKMASPSPSPSPAAVSNKTSELKFEVAAPSPTDSPSLAPQPSPSPEGKSDLQLIKEAFADKYGKPVEDVIVDIDQQEDPYAKGSVRFSGEMGGGMWLAYQQEEEWLIIHDGHGTIPCQKVDDYDFPSTMVGECFDEDSGVVVDR